MNILIKGEDRMKIVKIQGEDYGVKFNMGVLRRSTKILGISTPAIFEALSKEDMDVICVMIGQCIVAADRSFDVNLLDEIGFEEFTPILEAFAEEMAENMPQITETKKKTKTIKKK